MNDWGRFFDAYADRYDGECFTQNTAEELTFLCSHLRLGAGTRVLDIGCGTGRHSVGLARAGCRVTGVDQSEGMLRRAAERAAREGVSVEWVQQDAVQFSRADSYDAAICLCEGAMGLLGADDSALDRDLALLRNIHRSLRMNAPFVLNVLNGCRMIRAHTDEDVAAGRFSVSDLTETSDVQALLGNTGPTLQIRERGYTPPEIRRMLSWVGFEVKGVYGGTAGEWALRPPRLDEMELMIISEKTRTGGS